MNLTTQYLGLELKHPFMPGASPLAADLGCVRRLEDAGASAIVMNSLFEEQIVNEDFVAARYLVNHESLEEASLYLPRSDEFRLGPDAYLEQIRKIKAAVNIPVIASLNGTTPGGWIDFAWLIEEAGADALELNVYNLPTDLNQPGEQVEARLLEVVRMIKQDLDLPVAVKLSPFFSSLPNLCSRLSEMGADGLVLFNRFYQPDIDLETLEAKPALRLSDSSELLLRLRWTSVLAGQVKAKLAVSGGVHTADDAVKALLAGADVVQLVSALLQRGPEYLREVIEGATRWLTEHEYESLAQLRGSVSLHRCANPAVFERGNYMRVLHSWRQGSAPWTAGT